MNLGKKILEFRKRNGLSQEQFGEKLDVTRQTISNWELGETQPNPEQLKLLSKELNISIDELLDNDIKNVLIVKTSNTEKIASLTYKILKIFFIVVVAIILIIFGLFLNKIIYNFKDRGRLVDETIVCNLYGEVHSFNIRYYELTGEPKEFGGDSYFADILDLGKYNDVHQIFNIINDYVKKNGGICEMIKERYLSEIVDITIKDGTLTNTSASIIINDHSPNKIVYGSDFYIEKYENNLWNNMTPIHDDYAFNSMAYYVDENGILEMNHNWEYIYGSLDKGIYRLVKNVFFESDIPVGSEDEYYIWVEFEIG